MLIALDLDDTLAKSIDGFLAFYNSKYEPKLTVESFTAFTLHEILGMPKDEEDKILDEFDKTDHNKNLLPVEGAVDAVERLSKNHKLVIITSRLEKYEEETKEWIKKYFPMVNKIVFIRKIYQKNIKSKGEICKEIGAGLLIDDNLNHVLGCSKVGVKSILIDYPWNRGEIGGLITRVKTWKEIIKVIEDFNRDNQKDFQKHDKFLIS